MALEKALITDCVTMDQIPVQFNPEEYTLSKDINYATGAIPGLKGPILQFVSGNMQTLEMELLVDTYEKHEVGNRILNEAGQDVRDLTNKITGLMQINRDTHAPPILLFTWGSLHFSCVLARASQRFIMFRPDGIPVRARLTVTFNEYIEPGREDDDIQRQTADFTKLHTVRGDETLSSIAAQRYEDPTLWRAIALANGLDDPRAIAVGQQLAIPSLPYTNLDTGEVIG